MASSSSTNRPSKYDVFLSFRGDDTRRTIVSHMYAALKNKGVITFKDDRRLETGDSITEELTKAIQNSLFAIVVLSENYATSKWCLEELRMIMELQREDKLVVIPIFYGVDPSHVRKQEGSFAEPFERYDLPEMVEKVRTWREALTQVGSLTGKDSSQCVDEATMIREIVGHILSKLLRMAPTDSTDIVGMEAHMERMNTLLSIESKDEVRVIGIRGMGGVGKTTIAKCLYSQFSRRFFPYSCFVENIAKIHREHGSLYLQTQLISNILPEEDRMNLLRVVFGSEFIKWWLGRRRVFIVLDNVDKVEQIHALANETSWFGLGSRIIVTTRDKGLLDSCGVKTVYDVKCLDDDDALKAFKQFAFEGGFSPNLDYEQLSIRACRLARGLPSALKALGVRLRGKTTTREWEDAIRRFERAPDSDIMDILRTSFDGLDEHDKPIFLYIACLFNGEAFLRVVALLDDDESSIKLLAEKSLIDLSADGRINMHLLVEQVGKEIVRQESKNRPQKQKLLWDPQDISYVLSNRTGKEPTEGMALHLCEMSDFFSTSRSVLRFMPTLKFLKLYRHLNRRGLALRHIKDIDLLSYQLRLLHWDEYPLTTLPAIFTPECLVELNLRFSMLHCLWNGTVLELENLRRLDLTGSHNLKELPDLSKATKLEELKVASCPNLKRLPESIGCLHNLKKLITSRPTKSPEPIFLREYSQMSGKRIGLEFLRSRKQLKSLSDVSIEGSIDIELQHIQGKVTKLSFSSEYHQDLGNTSEFLIVKSLRFEGSYLHPFRCGSFSDFPCLKELFLSRLDISEIPANIGALLSLEKLDLSDNRFRNLPATMERLPKLKYLNLSFCYNLEALPKVTQVETLILSRCTRLQSLLPVIFRSYFEEDPGSYRLLELKLDGCDNIQSLSHQLPHFTNLKELDLTRHNFETIPTSITELSSLEVLYLDNCENLKSLVGLPLGLKILYARGCKSLETFVLPSNHILEYVMD